MSDKANNFARVPTGYDAHREIKRLRRELEAERRLGKKLRRRKRQYRELEPYQVELLKLQDYLETTDRKMIVLFDGRSAASKGGAIRRVTRHMNPRHYRVVALGKPTDQERTQWYLQRYVNHFPRGGEMVIFDRSWYTRAMVEPVLGFCTEKEHRDFLTSVVGFEKDLVRQGTILVKLYFSVPKDEQLRRFEKRSHDPLRRWKLSEADLQAQDLWEEFTERKYEMLQRTDSRAAPWTVVRSKDKHLARLNTMRVILDAVDYPDRNSALDFVPDPAIVISGAHAVEIMEVDRYRNSHLEL